MKHYDPNNPNATPTFMQNKKSEKGLTKLATKLRDSKLNVLDDISEVQRVESSLDYNINS